MKYHLTEANVKDLIAWLRAGHVDRAYKAIGNLLPAEVPQDVEEFIRKYGFAVDNNESAVTTSDLRAWMAGHARVPVEPTGKMWSAGRTAFNSVEDKVCYAMHSEIESAHRDSAPTVIWNAMLTASKERVE